MFAYCSWVTFEFDYAQSLVSPRVIQLPGKSPPAITTNQRHSVPGCSTTTSGPPFSSGIVERAVKSPPAIIGNALCPVVQPPLIFLRAGILERARKSPPARKVTRGGKRFAFPARGNFHARFRSLCTQISLRKILLAVYICVDALFKQPLQHEAYHPSFRDPIVIELTKKPSRITV